MQYQPHDSDHRRAELRKFLMNRRSRLRPRDFGMPEAARRRTPGLRREEVAVLAGIGVSWYQWLEQGRAISVSPRVLDAVSRVLRLDDVERRHVYALAGLNPPPSIVVSRSTVDSALLRLIEFQMPLPAHIVDPYWNIISMNDAARDVLGYRKSDKNCLTAFFTNPQFKSYMKDWAAAAARAVAEYRTEITARPDDPEFKIIVNELLTTVPEFAEVWARQDIAPAGVNINVITHPQLGDLFFDVINLHVPQFPELRIILHHPRPLGETGIDTLLQLERAFGARTAVKSATEPNLAQLHLSDQAARG